MVGLNTQGTDRTSPNEIVCTKQRHSLYSTYSVDRQIIYCDLSRITRNGDGVLWDPDVQGPLEDTDEFETCRSTEKALPKLVTGTMVAYVTGLSSSVHDRHVMQIQICAWYAKFMAVSQYRTGGRFSLYRLAAKLGTWAVKVLPNSKITVMDSLALLDNTLLHEVVNPQMDMRDAKK